ncbi:hypothetical protein [Haliangium ochraceum]|uniref:Uncharacterized protein n=1 Tax=Haliangium ochraceum (strain DSM 14365 / JCM 11303 / SMP-2) TaxID=502025 RepID=D0LUX7_HALO1|nr:hypothetical protein [Haliangium ochraceum]ACY14017.1 conserved hypothetical protein [Haliangium ochraceum DSM 14365]
MRYNMMFHITLLAIASIALAACDKQPQEQPSAAPAAVAPSAERAPAAAATHTDEAAHAHHGAEPGSYEDWCGAHQVPESLCTRCNPSLIAAFKATGDWCEEHGLPESQCLICNPELKIERPPRPDEATP